MPSLIRNFILTILSLHKTSFKLPKKISPYLFGDTDNALRFIKLVKTCCNNMFKATITMMLDVAYFLALLGIFVELN